MSITNTEDTLTFADVNFDVCRPHAFGLVINGICVGKRTSSSEDYLHDILLTPENRSAFWNLLEIEKLVVCKNLRLDHPGYRKVRGKSSAGKLSQAEYFHHDGCSCPTKPKVVEIRLPHQQIGRQIATAIAPFPDVIRAMLQTLPPELQSREDVAPHVRSFNATGDLPSVLQWDTIQGKVTRLVRREMDAESCRSWFRQVDSVANAYVHPWEMGESRLMLNNHADLAATMQHRRSYQQHRESLERNGSLVKRWPAEELLSNDMCSVVAQNDPAR